MLCATAKAEAVSASAASAVVPLAHVEGDSESGPEALSRPSKFHRFSLSVGAGLQFLPLSESLMGFLFAHADLGFFITPNFQVFGEIGSHPSSGASDYGTRASENFYGIHLKTFWGDADELIAKRARGGWQLYATTGLESRRIALSSSVGSSSANPRRIVEGTLLAFDVGVGMQWTRRRFTIGADFIRFRIPVRSTFDVDDGAENYKRDSYFQGVGCDVGFVYAGTGF